jgi:alpha-beta hydrolase superfamily lysophospholipase
MARRLATRAALGTIRQGVRALLYGTVGAAILLIALFVVHLERRPDLEVWHTAELDEEFGADSPVDSFEAYLALEDRLFAQLDQRVYDRVEPAPGSQINRYSRGSLSDPGRWPTDWNRSFEWTAPNPVAGVLLVHGMSDSPYSMRSLGRRLHREGAWVLGLRVPGHGTAPVGLVEVEWEDMAAAVALAAKHLHGRLGDRPLYIVGYSNGGALAVLYALSSLEDASLPAPRGLVLISPQIGVTKLAALAVWQERLGGLMGLHKLAWNSILLEYDPYKYGSFALNAGKQAYLLTHEIQSRITRLAPSGALERFPALLAFQSVVDATITAPALVRGLFQRLPPGPHELVLFDINRSAEIESLLKANPTAWVEDTLQDRDLGFAVTLVTNESGKSRRVVARHRGPGDRQSVTIPLGLVWPPGLYSLSHVALPFPPKDPLYGGPDAGPSPGIKLGDVALRGERGALQVSASDQLRLRWNPFHAYQERRVLDFIR